MRGWLLLIVAAILMVVSAADAAWAQTDACGAISDPSRRSDCYDNVYGAGEGAKRSDEAMRQRATEAEAARATQERSDAIIAEIKKQKSCTSASDLDQTKLRVLLEVYLPDASSSRFQALCKYSSRRELGVVMCGLINSKNQAGGYTGYSSFYFSENGPKAILERGAAEVGSIVFSTGHCSICSDTQRDAKACLGVVNKEHYPSQSSSNILKN